jgi:hypothetical protein
MPSKENNVFT